MQARPAMRPTQTQDSLHIAVSPTSRQNANQVVHVNAPELLDLLLLCMPLCVRPHVQGALWPMLGSFFPSLQHAIFVRAYDCECDCVPVTMHNEANHMMSPIMKSPCFPASPGQSVIVDPRSLFWKTRSPSKK